MRPVIQVLRSTIFYGESEDDSVTGVGPCILCPNSFEISIQDSPIRFPSLTSILGGSAHWQLPCQVVALIATTV